MRPQRQLIEHNPEAGRYGDCYRTCIAVLLDMDAAEVPHFYDQAGCADLDAAQLRRDAWLAERGLASVTFAWLGEGMTLNDVFAISSHKQPGRPIILCGTSSLGCNHSVVIMDGAIVCDPSGNGIVGPLDCGTWEVEVLAVGPDWRARTEPR